MKILLGSTNPSKKKSVEMALNELGIDSYEILALKVESGVNSKPIGYEIVRGADNRNRELREYATNNNIEYDYLLSIEGGFTTDENGIPFIVTYCITEDKNGKKSTGKSLGLRLRKIMFNYIRDGHSLNKLIEEINGSDNNKQNGGITSYLSNGIYSREKVDKDAVLSSLIPFIYKKERDLIEEQIKLKLSKK